MELHGFRFHSVHPSLLFWQLLLNLLVNYPKQFLKFRFSFEEIHHCCFRFKNYNVWKQTSTLYYLFWKTFSAQKKIRKIQKLVFKTLCKSWNWKRILFFINKVKVTLFKSTVRKIIFTRTKNFFCCQKLTLGPKNKLKKKLRFKLYFLKEVDSTYFWNVDQFKETCLSYRIMRHSQLFNKIFVYIIWSSIQHVFSQLLCGST